MNKDKIQVGMFFIAVIPHEDGGGVWFLCVEDTIYKKSLISFIDREGALSDAQAQLRELLTVALAALP